MPSVMAQLSPAYLSANSRSGISSSALGSPVRGTSPTTSARPRNSNPPKLEEIMADVDDYGDSVVALEVRPALTFDY